MRRTVRFDLHDLSNEELVLSAEEAFLELDQRESNHERSKWEEEISPSLKRTEIEDSTPTVQKWRRYPAYKTTGVEWLGEIPAHWEEKRLKYVVEMNPDTLSEETPPEYLLRYVDIGNVDSTGQILDTEEVTFDTAPSRARRRVQNGDTILSTVRTYLKAIAFIEAPPQNLIVSTGFAVLRPKPEILPKFLWRLVQSSYFIDAVVAHSEGVSYPAINPSRLGCCQFGFLPFSEQRAIAAFLDHETAKIDALVAKKKRLIELLQEKRISLINHAVTHGLDPTVPLKDSGIEWLGEIPTHWEIVPLRWYISIRSGDSLPNTAFDLEPSEIMRNPVIGGNGVMGYTDVTNINVPIIVVGRVGALCGNIHLIAVPVWVTDNALMLTNVRDFELGYLALVLQTMNLNRLASHTAQPLVTGGLVRSQRTPFPPPAEQRAIVGHANELLVRIDALTAKIRGHIEKLHEYRTALISAAVTGKIDVLRGDDDGHL